MKRIGLILALGICAVFPLFAQCFDISSLYVDGTTCYCADHKWHKEEDGTNIYSWIWTSNAVEDYGLTGHNTKYNLDNILCTRQTVINSPGQDYFQPSLSMLPPGEQYSIRLGNPRAGGKGAPEPNPSPTAQWHLQAEGITFEYTVDPFDPILKFQYAAVMCKPNHTLTGVNLHGQPRIEVYLTDLSGNKLNAQQLAFSRWGDNTITTQPEWQYFYKNSANYYWKDWTTTSFDLSNYTGQTVILHIENYDCVVSSPTTSNFTYCSDDRHFSYLYFFLDCTEKSIDIECLPGRKARLTATDGYKYEWYEKDKPSIILGTEQSLEVTKTDGHTTYCCRLRQKEGMTGTFILEATPKCNPETYLADTICSCETPYNFNGQTLYHSGIYEHVIPLSPEMDSITYLDLTVLEVVDKPLETVTICDGQEYEWKNHPYKFKHLTEAGDYYDTLRYQSTHCDSVRYHLRLNLVSTINSTENMNACMDALITGFKWHDTWVYSGNYTTVQWNTKTVGGCDSIVALNLSIVSEIQTTDTVIVPSTTFTPFSWNGLDINNMSKDGKTKKLTSFTGCDSIVTLRLIVAKDSIDVLHKCDNELPFLWHEHTIHGTQNNGLRVSEKDIHGKDSIFYTLDLHLHRTYHTDTTISICDGESYLLGDTLLKTNGTYTRNLSTTTWGCDSTVNLKLVIQKPQDKIKITRGDICSGEYYEWATHGARYSHLTEEGIYYDTLRYTTGCDSVYHQLKLYVHHVTTEPFILTDTICQGDSLNFFGTILKTPGYYQTTIQNPFGCDSLVGMNLLVGTTTYNTIEATFPEGGTYYFNGKSYTASGTYQDTLLNTMGCDSVVTLNLTEVVIPLIYRTDSISICHGFDTIFWRGDTILGDEYLIPGTPVIDLPRRVAPCRIAQEEIYNFELEDEDLVPETYCSEDPLSPLRTYADSVVLSGGTDPDTIVFLCLTVKPTFIRHDTIHLYGGSDPHTFPFPWHGYTISGMEDNEMIYHSEFAERCIDSVLHLIPHTCMREQRDTICQGESIYFADSIFATSGTFVRTIVYPDACDSVLTLHLMVYPHSDTLKISDAACTSYTWHNHVYTESGSYLFDTINHWGCDSVEQLTLTIHQPTSCDTLKIIDTACNSYTWHNHVYTESGSYLFDTINHLGCDSVEQLSLTIHQPTSSTNALTICEGLLPYSWNDMVCNAAGTFSTHLTNVNGCDSLATLQLSVSDHSASDTSATICQADLPYHWYEHTLTETTTAQHTFHTGVCDSIVTLHLTVHHASDTVFMTKSECVSYTWHGNTYTTSGTYTFDTLNAVGCDSVEVLSLTVLQPSAGEMTIVECDAFEWHGNTYTASGDYTFDTINTVGCDSVVTLHLTIHPSFHPDTIVTACDSFTWYGITYTETPVINPTFSVLTADGCDSIVTLNLTILHASDTVFTTMSECMSYTWHGNTYTTSGTYTFDTLNAVGCDSVEVLSLTVLQPSAGEMTIVECDAFEWHGNTYTASGDYTFDTINVVGCDSMVTLHLTIQKAVTLPPDEVQIMEGETYTWTGHDSRFVDLDESGIYLDTAYFASGCDSAYYTLKLDVIYPAIEGQLTIDTLCADEPALDIRFVCRGGKPLTYDVVFEGDARKYFSDSLNCPYPNDSILIHSAALKNFDEPYIRPDDYRVSLVFKNAKAENFKFSSPFMVLYPSSILTQRWNDILILNNPNYNGNYAFSDVVWYHEGQKVTPQGENNGYIYEPLVKGDRYWVEVTRTDDHKTIRTCDFVPTNTDEMQTRFATLRVGARHIDNLRQLQVITNLSGTYCVYDAIGTPILIGNFGENYGSPDILLPESGCYILHFMGDEGSTYTTKWIAK